MDGGASRGGRQAAWREAAERASEAFGALLALVVLTYVLSSLLDNRGWSSVVLCAATGATSIVALSAAGVGAGAVRVALQAAAVSIVLAAIGAATGTHAWLTFASVAQISLLAVAMGAVLVRVVGTAAVNSRTILGAVSVYTVLGLLFTYLYATVERIQGTPFFEGVARTAGSDFVFFSYTTLTTTGYGDLVPAGQPGRMLAGLEMMIGQIFLVTLVAGLVSLWRPGEALRRRHAAERRGGA